MSKTSKAKESTATVVSKCCGAELTYQQDVTQYYVGTKMVWQDGVQSLNDLVEDYGQAKGTDAIDGGDFKCSDCGNILDGIEEVKRGD